MQGAMPQPIDPSSELGRVSAAERVQQMMERNAQLAQLRSAEVGANDTLRHQEQVLQAEQKQAQVEEELRRRAPYVAIKKNKNPGDDSEQDESYETYNARQQRELLGEGEHGLDVTL
jgi:hypothetical protein